MKKFFKGLVLAMTILIASCQGAPAYAADSNMSKACDTYANLIGRFHIVMKDGTFTAKELIDFVNTSQDFAGADMQSVRKDVIDGIILANLRLKYPTQDIKNAAKKICMTGAV